MPMLKTADSGTTNITNVKNYLEKEQRQEHDRYLEEMKLYEEGKILLPDNQVGYLREYLGETSRALAVDVSDDLSKRNWARQMDLTRAQYGHDKATKRGRPRTYYHFILSPNMDDGCSLKTIRSYSKAWAEENFRNGERMHEYAIIPHDDNTRGILHAHIIVNVTDKATGKKLHLSNDEVVALGRSAQEIGKRYGLTPIHEDGEYQRIGVRTKQPVYLSRNERELLNQGKYSWKWELRQVVSDLAPLSDGYDDFRFKLNRAGYDVSRSAKTGYLTYTHRNGMKVKDSNLGARFYLESLEQWFNRENALSDKTYSSWELIKISKGNIPWKEDIRRAIDAVAPSVMSLSELQKGLEDLYGIRLIINRRGITYQHPKGFKTRDMSIGFRYTIEGLQRNAILGLSLPYPGFDSIMGESSMLMRQYLPRHARSGRIVDSDQAAAHFVYHDMSKMMVRMGLVRIDDIPKKLAEREIQLRETKTELVANRNELMRWNHLVALKSRLEKDRTYLRDNAETSEAGLYNDTLLRYERIKLYLSEQAGGMDIKATQSHLSEEYEKKLQSYQERAEELSRDMTVYQNYLVGKSVQDFTGNADGGEGVDVQSLFAAGKTLENYHIRDFFHLEQTLSAQETRLELLQFKLGKATERKQELQLVHNDILAYREEKNYAPVASVLEKSAASLDLETHIQRLAEISNRLEQRGVKESDFSSSEDAYQKASMEYDVFLEEYNHLQMTVKELREAKDVCRAVADMIIAPHEQSFGQFKKTASSGSSSTLVPDNTLTSTVTDGSSLRQPSTVEDLPFEEAKRRHQERLRRSPERSKRHRLERER